MELPIKESAYARYQVGQAFVPKVDKETGAVRLDRDSSLALHVGQLVAYGPNGAEILSVTVAAEQPPKLSPGQDVTVTGLVAIPWATREGTVRVSYRAQSVQAVAAHRAA
jgi:hypothetical protein